MLDKEAKHWSWQQASAGHQ